MDILNYNWIFPDISNSVCLVARVCVCVFYLAKDYRRMNFSETSTVYMSCIRTWSFNSRLISHFV